MQERGVDPERVVLIPHGVAIDAGPVERRNGTTPTVGTVCRLEPPKRIDVFLDVIAELRRRGVACNAVVVGDGSLRATLREAARERGLEGTVTFAGQQDDVAAWLDRFDVFLVTSEVETFGIAALEAMARGVPVVAMPSAGGLPALAERGGVLLERRDVSEAATVVEELLTSPERRAELRERGARVAEEHRLEHSIGALDNMYAGLKVQPGARTGKTVSAGAT
jgi:glycosyltransferase involved in cell wall biosynthesis